MTDLNILGKCAKEAAPNIAALDTEKKNQVLLKVAEALETHFENVLKANEKDIGK